LSNIWLNPPPENTTVSRATLAAIRQLASQQPTIYLPIHDPESASRLAARSPASLAAA
jgi:hypothetical protein